MLCTPCQWFKAFIAIGICGAIYCQEFGHQGQELDREEELHD